MEKVVSIFDDVKEQQIRNYDALNIRQFWEAKPITLINKPTFYFFQPLEGILDDTLFKKSKSNPLFF